MSPFYPDSYTGCFGGCEPDLLRILNVDKLNSGIMNPGGHNGNRGRGDGRGARGGNRGGAAPRDGGGGGRGPPRGGGGPGGHGPPRGGGGAGAMAVRGNQRRGGGAPRGNARGRPVSGGGRGRGRGGANDSGYSSGTNNTSSFNTGQEDEVSCRCGIPATKRTVQKEGANQGREFYCCSKQQGEQCGYFLWAEEAQNTAYGGGGGGNEVVNCNCGQPSARRTVQKEGGNKGREFLCCPKPREEQCGYFQWADELDTGNGGGGYGG